MVSDISSNTPSNSPPNNSSGKLTLEKSNAATAPRGAEKASAADNPVSKTLSRAEATVLSSTRQSNTEQSSTKQPTIKHAETTPSSATARNSATYAQNSTTSAPAQPPSTQPQSSQQSSGQQLSRPVVSAAVSTAVPPQKAQYDVTIVFNRQGTQATPQSTSVSTPPGQPTATQLTTDVIQQINQGLLTKVRITTDLRLSVGDRLILSTTQGTAQSATPGTTPNAMPNATSTTMPNTAPAPGPEKVNALPSLQLNQIHPVPQSQKVQQVITNLIRTLLPAQNSYAPLLANIIALTSSKQGLDGLLKQLPPNIQQAVGRIAQNLPTAESLSSTEAVKHAIKNSGVFLESGLKQQTTVGKADGNLVNASRVSETNEKALSQTKTNLTHQTEPSNNLKAGTARTTQANPANSANPTTASTSTPTPSAGTPPLRQATSQATPTDFKQQLLILEKALSSGTPQKAPTTNPTVPNSKVPASTLPGEFLSNQSAIAGKGVENSIGRNVERNAVANSPTVINPTKQPMGEKQVLEALAQMANAKNANTQNSDRIPPVRVDLLPEAQTKATHSTARSALSNPLTSPKNNTAPPLPSSEFSSHSGIKAYQQSSISNPALLGLPPLPGQMFVQAQTHSKATLKGNEVADALIKILLKQTQESLSRLQLHQLSTAASHADESAAGTQSPISFDLPILHFGQLTIFHFHIEEEANSGGEKKDESQDKKWSVSMGFDIDGLGAMFCELSLVNTHVYVRFWAMEKETVSRAKSYFDTLSSNLNHIGVTVKELECVEGMPPQQQQTLQQSLIDVET